MTIKFPVLPNALFSCDDPELARMIRDAIYHLWQQVEGNLRTHNVDSRRISTIPSIGELHQIAIAEISQADASWRDMIEKVTPIVFRNSPPSQQRAYFANAFIAVAPYLNWGLGYKNADKFSICRHIAPEYYLNVKAVPDNPKPSINADPDILVSHVKII